MSPGEPVDHLAEAAEADRRYRAFVALLDEKPALGAHRDADILERRTIPNQPEPYDDDDAGGAYAPPEPEPAEVVLLREQLIFGDAITRIPPPAPLVEGVLDLNSIAVLFGQPGHGKSFIAVDLAAHVSAGKDWHGQTVTAARVLYLAAEDTAGLGVRFAAWTERHGVYERHQTDLAWLGQSVNLFEARWADAVAQLAVELKVGLVVVDTLAKSMVGVDENASKDMGVVISHVDRIRIASGACVVLVHHQGKDRERGMRGSNSLLAGCDMAWEISLTERRIEMNCQRQKNHAQRDRPLEFELSASLESCVVQALDRGPDLTIHKAAVDTLRTLAEIETAGGISPSVWKMAGTTAERSFFRHVKGLIDNGCITNIGTTKQPKYIITDSGRELL